MDFLYLWEDDLRLLGSISVGIIIGLIIVVLGPNLGRWKRAVVSRSKIGKEEFRELLRTAGKDQPNEIRRRAQLALIKLVAKEMTFVVLMLTAIVYGFWFLHHSKDQALKSRWTQQIEILDGQKKRLALKTIREPDSPICEKSESPDEDELRRCVQYHTDTSAILRQQLLCGKRARIQAAQTMRDDVTRLYVTLASYELCMLEAGWWTEECERGEEGCAEIPFIESPCTLQARAWLKGEGTVWGLQECKMGLHSRPA